MTRPSAAFLVGVGLVALQAAAAEQIPWPEHPRPDFQRSGWLNLNGTWAFGFDPQDTGEKESWYKPGHALERQITVPFPWESRLSGIADTAYQGVAWYSREVTVPDGKEWKGRDVWLIIGACDWECAVWVDGNSAGKHTGGYVPAEMNLSKYAKPGQKITLTIRAVDRTDPQQPTGKQIGWYTRTSGIWQTVYLEPRSESFIRSIRGVPDLQAGTVTYTLVLDRRIVGEKVRATSPDGSFAPAETPVVPQSVPLAKVAVQLTNPLLWTPDSPKLYPVIIELLRGKAVVDRVESYFGLREISTAKAPGGDYQYITLNGKPIYLRGLLHQSFHPAGIYQYPDDATMRGDYELCKRANINFVRIHIKVPIPRELYWADKLGVMVMQDMPNFGRYTEQARTWWGDMLQGAVARDFNHPAIFAWVDFNETWGIGDGGYKPDHQQWVELMYHATKQLDPTRLAEDNSACMYDHVATDINSWHFYINDYAEARKHIREVVDKTHPGSTFNFAGGRSQGSQPLINSEYGGISAGLGDQDISWCLKYLTNELRLHDKICGYIYTELSDIEWEHNGLVNYDRSPKQFGYDYWHPGFSLKDINNPDYVAIDAPPCIELKADDKREVPVKISHWSDYQPARSASEGTDRTLRLRWRTDWLDRFGNRQNGTWQSQPATWEAYKVVAQPPIALSVDRSTGSLGALLVELVDGETVIARNYVNLLHEQPPAPRVEVLDERRVAVRFKPADFSTWYWPDQQPPATSGIAAEKVSAHGHGYVEYTVMLPEKLDLNALSEVQLSAVLSAKAADEKLDWPARKTPHDYPQTDTRKWPTDVRISINGLNIGEQQRLPDDPADARGVLSHVRQFQPGSWGWLKTVNLTGEAIKQALAGTRVLRRWTIKFEVPPDAEKPGGLEIFGEGLGGQPVDPTLTLSFEPKHGLAADFTSDAPVAVRRQADRYQAVLPTAERGGHAWRYTTSDPGPKWFDPTFDDQAWKTGKGGFGTRETPNAIIGTRWRTADIWLRTEINVDKLGSVEHGAWRVYHDEDAEVYLNGTKVLDLRDYVTTYEDVPLSNDGLKSLQDGRNVIAVHCRQTAGGQNIDVGLTLIRRQVD